MSTRTAFVRTCQRVSNIQLFQSRLHYASLWGLTLFRCYNSRFLLTWVPSAGGTPRYRSSLSKAGLCCRKPVITGQIMGQEQIQHAQILKSLVFEQVCLLNCVEQGLALCSQLRVNGCFCNFHAVLCAITSQSVRQKPFFLLLLSCLVPLLSPPRCMDYHSRFA